MPQRIGNEVYHLRVIDTLDTAVNKKLMSTIENANHKLEEHTTSTAGFEKKVHLCMSAKVMLKRRTLMQDWLTDR